MGIRFTVLLRSLNVWIRSNTKNPQVILTVFLEIQAII